MNIPKHLIPAIPKLLKTSAQMRSYSQENCEDSIALVPTMGALHEGHLGLVEAARANADRVIVSIFVNPTQFGPSEDLDHYPRQLEADLTTLANFGGVDVVFAPAVSEMYLDGIDQQAVWITPSSMADVLCGAFRPGHFRGVATVVGKLFSICRPDLTVFGLKDAQQFIILQKMARDLCFQTELLGVQTIRESDGLALSSRNRFLSTDERAQAIVLSRSIFAAKDAVEGSEKDAERIRSIMDEIIAEADLGLAQYADVVDASTLQPLVSIDPGQHVLCAVSVFFGSTRLIDNSFAFAS